MEAVEGWVTTLGLIFGIAVALLGVVAYLRMFRKGTGGPAFPHSEEPADPAGKQDVRAEPHSSDEADGNRR
ncbi:hypothetical protein ABEV74_01200 [Paenibacillus cisolokensis]|uniref:hypothetical protein n=1 Tax=Paenibacillus cisolokensis TaxID=1658519 RepID=UPI003D2C14E1